MLNLSFSLSKKVLLENIPQNTLKNYLNAIHYKKLNTLFYFA